MTASTATQAGLYQPTCRLDLNGNSQGEMIKPMAGENLTFHVIVNRPEKSFSIDGPDGPNGVWLHFEMSRVARLQGKQLRDFAMRAPSHEAALSEMHSMLPDYLFLGPWSSKIASR